MTDDVSLEDAAPPAPELRLVVTVDDLAAVDFEGPICGLDLADAHEFYPVYERAAVAAREANNEIEQAVYVLFARLCSMVMESSDRGNNWQPMLTFSNGTRFPTAEDFRGGQTVTLATIVDKISCVALRARVADIVWSNNRQAGGPAAAKAVESYCDAVTGLLSGHLKTSHGRKTPHEAMFYLKRAVQIADATTKRTKRPAKIDLAFYALYAAAREHLDIWTYVSVAELALSIGLWKPTQVAADLEAMAGSLPAGTYPMAVKRAWDLAAHLYEKLRDKTARQRCLLAAVEQTLAMRREVKGSAAAEASWVTDALQELRHVEGTEDRRQALQEELRGLQATSLDQMGRFEVDLELGDTPEKVAEHFATLNLSEALKSFALLERSRNPDDLRKYALESVQDTPMIAMMSGVHLDGEGRPESRSAGAPLEGEPDETWFRRSIGQFERLRRERAIAGMIDPARLIIQMRFGIAERHFSAIVGHSWFVPDSQKAIVALGFTRLFQGDMMSATHLLIPQLEPCLRHILKLHGEDPSKRRDDSTEEDLALSGLYFRFRLELDKILTPSVASEIDLLFNAKPGPELRHELAHGQIGAGNCFDPSVYYANWFIYRLCCIPVFRNWETIVTPQLQAQE